MKSAFPRPRATPISAVSTTAGLVRVAWPWLFWALWGAWLAASDLRNDEIQPAAARLLAGAALLGFGRPARWWGWALALGAWVTAEPLVAIATRTPMAYPANWGVLLAFVPAFLGAAVGAALRAGALPPRR